VAEWYANLFDGRYYLEVQAHGSPGQAELNEQIFGLATELGFDRHHHADAVERAHQADACRHQGI
jgi:DNA polymerase III alpha subunit